MLQAGVPEKEMGSINCEYSLFYLFTKGTLRGAMSVVINFCNKHVHGERSCMQNVASRSPHFFRDSVKLLITFMFPIFSSLF